MGASEAEGPARFPASKEEDSTYGKEDLSPAELRVLATSVERVDGRRDVPSLRHQGGDTGGAGRHLRAEPAHGGPRLGRCAGGQRRRGAGGGRLQVLSLPAGREVQLAPGQVGHDALLRRYADR